MSGSIARGAFSLPELHSTAASRPLRVAQPVPDTSAECCLAKRSTRWALALGAVLICGAGVTFLLLNHGSQAKQALPSGPISAPSQVSIAAGKSSDQEIAITWLTNDTRDDEASCKNVAVVQISGAGAIAAEIECLRYQFTAGYTPRNHFPLDYSSGRIHRVRIGNLKADTEYQYSLAGDAERWQRRFRTLPATLKGQASYPIIFGVTGDLGQTKDSAETARHIDADPTLQMVLHPGDMSYADTDQGRWDSYGLKMENLTSRLQWMVCPGNHEIESDARTGVNFVPYEARFVMPRVQPPDNKPSPSQVNCLHPKGKTGNDCTPSVFSGSYDWGNSFYAFDAGPARIISLNTYTDTRPGSPQHTWLKAEMEALKLRRAETPWLIVQMHCPWYTSNAAHYEEKQAVEMRDANGFEDIFFENQVAIVLAGHVHAYERSYPVYKQAVNPQGPTYIVIGDGGNREGHARNYRAKPAFSAYRNGTNYGHGRLTLTNNTHMRWEWMAHADVILSALTEENRKTPAWRSSLASRTSHDAAWIENPWSAAQEKGAGDSWSAFV